MNVSLQVLRIEGWTRILFDVKESGSRGLCQTRQTPESAHCFLVQLSNGEDVRIQVISGNYAI